MLPFRNALLTEEFDYNFIIDQLSGFKHPRVKINDMLKKGEIIRVKKGLYVFGEAYTHALYSKETLANLIYGPSYISLEYALSFYGLIPERVETITSITNKRNKRFVTPVGDFCYRYISPSLFPPGVTLHEQDRYHSILIATKEKALCDVLYFADPLMDQDALASYLFQNLRMEISDLKNLDMKKVKRLSTHYKKNTVLLSQFLEQTR
jgi:hypothetical protein